jgi:hypothetical protein
MTRSVAAGPILIVAFALGCGAPRGTVGSGAGGDRDAGGGAGMDGAAGGGAAGNGGATGTCQSSCATGSRCCTGSSCSACVPDGEDCSVLVCAVGGTYNPYPADCTHRVSADAEYCATGAGGPHAYLCDSSVLSDPCAPATTSPAANFFCCP